MSGSHSRNHRRSHWPGWTALSELHRSQIQSYIELRAKSSGIRRHPARALLPGGKSADKSGMNVNALSNSEAYLQSILSGAASGTNSTGSTSSSSSTASASASSLTMPADSHQPSPFAQMMTTLQQLQQQNPSEFQEVTAQISTNLQNAAQTAQTQGNTNMATQLNALATVFQNASTSGQMPTVSDMVQAYGGPHHHHHAAGSYSAGSQSGALDPMAIIMQTLSSAASGTSSSPAGS